MSTAHSNSFSTQAMNLCRISGALGAISASRIAQYAPLKVPPMPSCFFRAMGFVPAVVEHTRTVSSRPNSCLRLFFALACALDTEPVVMTRRNLGATA